MLRIIPLLLLAACGSTRCIDVEVTVVNASEGQVRLLLEQPSNASWVWDEERQGNVLQIYSYWVAKAESEPVSAGEVKRLSYCPWYYDDDPWRISAWIEPETAEPSKCAAGEGNRCPPSGAPLVETNVIIEPEGRTLVTLTLDATPPQN